MAIPQTENPAWGFYGTIRSSGLDADHAWAVALPIVAQWWAGSHERIAQQRARLFLDGQGGRHLAIEVRFTACFIVERIENGKSRRSFLYREPGNGTWFGIHQRQCTAQKVFQLLFLAGLCLKRNVQREFAHRILQKMTIPRALLHQRA